MGWESINVGLDSLCSQFGNHAGRVLCETKPRGEQEEARVDK